MEADRDLLEKIEKDVHAIRSKIENHEHRITIVESKLTNGIVGEIKELKNEFNKMKGELADMRERLAKYEEIYKLVWLILVGVGVNTIMLVLRMVFKIG